MVVRLSVALGLLVLTTDAWAEPCPQLAENVLAFQVTDYSVVHVIRWSARADLVHNQYQYTREFSEGRPSDAYYGGGQHAKQVDALALLQPPTGFTVGRPVQEDVATSRAVGALYPTGGKSDVIQRRLLVRFGRSTTIIETQGYIESATLVGDLPLVATTEKSPVKPPLGFGRLFRFLNPHPAPYYRVTGRVYGLDGPLLCEQTLLKRIAQGNGFVESRTEG